MSTGTIVRSYYKVNKRKEGRRGWLDKERKKASITKNKLRRQ
jgi:hypothetical protein